MRKYFSKKCGSFKLSFTLIKAGQGPPRQVPPPRPSCWCPSGNAQILQSSTGTENAVPGRVREPEKFKQFWDTICRDWRGGGIFC